MKFYLYSIAFLFSNILYGQTSLSGVVQGESGDGLTNATVVLLNPEDSILVKFGITDLDGKFEIQDIPKKTFLVKTSYLGYQTNFQTISFKEENNPFIEIDLQEDSELIEEVVVKEDRIPIQIKNDTIEYDAQAFKTQPNADLEALLKKLPGVEVDRQGNLKAQGEQVGKVLVDGKEFFGDDPKIATKNLPADAVDKVQVFDKLSEIAEFTGIDDGNEQKTINISLKDDHKQGYFGKVQAGYGTKDRYEGKFNLNRFSNRSQFSLISSLNNINEQAFTINDYIKLNGGLSSLMNGGGTLELDGSDALFFQDPDKGFTNTQNVGVNFNYDFSDKTILRYNYFYNYLDKRQERNVSSINFLEDSEFVSEEAGLAKNKQSNHRFDTKLEHSFSPFRKLSFKNNVRFTKSNNSNQSLKRTFVNGNDLQNQNQTNFFGTSNKTQWNSELIYKHRFKKPGRNFISSFTFFRDWNNRSSDLDAENGFPMQQMNIGDTLLQNQIQDNDQFGIGATLKYIEPIGKKKYLELNYELEDSKSDAAKDIFDIYEAVATKNEGLSNAYQRRFQAHKIGFNIKKNTKKVKLTLGGKFQNTTLKNEILSEAIQFNRNYQHFLPNAQFQFDLGGAENLRANYSTRIRVPSVQQLQPVINNANPLRIYIGNPTLIPAYTHQFNLSYMKFNQFSFTSFFGNINASYTSNSITETKAIDSLFRETVSPINTEKEFRVSTNFNFSNPLKFIDAKIQLDANLLYQNGFTILNNVENSTNRWINTFGVNLENRNKKWLDILVGFSLTQNSNTYSISKNFNNQFLNESYFIDLNISLSKSLRFNSKFDVQKFGGAVFNDNQNIKLWDLSLKHQILKDKRAEISFSVNDVLDQNKGINRFANLNTISNEQILSLGRYFMVGFVYKISKFNGGEDQIIFEERR